MEGGFRLTMITESMHALGVPVPRREESPYPMGGGECPYPRMRGECPIPRGEYPYRKSRGECAYPKSRGDCPYPKRRRDSLTTWVCLVQHMERKSPKFT